VLDSFRPRSAAAPTRRVGPRRVAALLGASGLGVLLLVGGPLAGDARADGGERVRSLAVTLALRSDGSMHVTETVTYDFGDSSGKHGIFRYLPLRRRFDADRDRIYPITAIDVSSPSGAPSQWERTADDPVTLRIGAENLTVRGVQVYVLSYDLAGVVDVPASGPELNWNAVGDGWEVPIDRAVVTVGGPAGAVAKVACFQGARGSTQPCSATTAGAGATFMASRPLDARQGLTVVAGFPATAFAGARPVLVERWSVAKAFAVTPVSGALGGVVLLALAGGAGLVAGRKGRDRRYLGVVPGLAPLPGAVVRTARVGRRAPVAVQFTPPSQLRVGELGTLVDERADVVDVTATIIDLAVRGYLRIEEVGLDDPPEPDDDDDDEGAEDEGDEDEGDEDEGDEDEGDEDDGWSAEDLAAFAELRADAERTEAENAATAERKAARQAARRTRRRTLWRRLTGRPVDDPARLPVPGPVAVPARAPAVVEPTSRTSGGDLPGDWRLVRADRGTADLRAYEQTLYDAIFASRRTVTLTRLRSTFSGDLSTAQTQLYQEVVARGWFTADPRSVRRRWYALGATVFWLGIAATVLLAIFTHLALVGVALTAAGAVILLLAPRMPARTAEGTALLAQTLGFRLYLETAEADQIRMEEGMDVFSRYLPYAIVFGVAERWAGVFATLAARSGSGASVDTSWYGGAGAGPDGGLDLLRFGTAVHAFSATVTSSIAASAPASASSDGGSGFSGGFSGDGGGGGGGGSW